MHINPVRFVEPETIQDALKAAREVYPEADELLVWRILKVAVPPIVVRVRRLDEQARAGELWRVRTNLRLRTQQLEEAKRNLQEATEEHDLVLAAEGEDPDGSAAAPA